MLGTVSQELKNSIADATPAGSETIDLVTTSLQQMLTESQLDRPMWEDWETFWQRCQTLIVAIAKIYHPEVKYPATEYLRHPSLRLDSGHDR